MGKKEVTRAALNALTLTKKSVEASDASLTLWSDGKKELAIKAATLALNSSYEATLAFHEILRADITGALYYPLFSAMKFTANTAIKVGVLTGLINEEEIEAL